MRSMLTEATCNIRRQATRPPARRANPDNKSKTRGPRQDAGPGCRRDHRGRWSFPAHGFPHFSHPVHTTRRSNGASGKGDVIATYPAPSACSACPFLSEEVPGEEQTCIPWPKALHTLHPWRSGHSKALRGNLPWCPGTSVGACVNHVSYPGPLSLWQFKPLRSRAGCAVPSSTAAADLMRVR